MDLNTRRLDIVLSFNVPRDNRSSFRERWRSMIRLYTLQMANPDCHECLLIRRNHSVRGGLKWILCANRGAAVLFAERHPKGLPRARLCQCPA